MAKENITHDFLKINFFNLMGLWKSNQTSAALSIPYTSQCFLTRVRLVPALIYCRRNFINILDKVQKTDHLIFLSESYFIFLSPIVPFI